MSLSDPIADMLNRIRNAHAAGIVEVDVPYSKIKDQIAAVLVREGYLAGVSTHAEGVRKWLRLLLKYYGRGQAAVKGMRRVSAPGLRRYVRADAIPKVKGGTGIAIMSTPGGIVTGHEARKRRLGGEVICFVW